MIIRKELVEAFLQITLELEINIDDKDFFKKTPKIKFLENGSIEIGDDDADNFFFLEDPVNMNLIESNINTNNNNNNKIEEKTNN